MLDAVTEFGAFRFNGFDKVMHGLDALDDPSEVADRIEEHLAWMAVAGEAQVPDNVGIEMPHLFRAYPCLVDTNLSDIPFDAKQLQKEVLQRLSTADQKLGRQAILAEYQTGETLRSLVGSVNEEVLGHPLKCCIYQPNTTAFRDGMPSDVWQSVGVLVGSSYKHINNLLHRPGGKLLLVQLVVYDHKTAKLSNKWRAVQELGPNRYRVVPYPREKGVVPKSEVERCTKLVDGAYALSLRRRYDWEVEFALTKERTGLVITTDAEGVREMLASRAKAPRGRRAALVHWVREHWRKSHRTAPSSDTGETLVRSHMRGRVECEYGGMYCRIYPSQYDLDRASNGEKFEARINKLVK